jgi:hypothetical protein
MPRENNVDGFTRAINSLLELLIEFGDLVLAALVAVELWLRGQLTVLGVAPPIQVVILVALALALILAALRLFGGLIRVAVVLVLVLIVIHALLPIIQQP